jgi:hypothetical protein
VGCCGSSGIIIALKYLVAVAAPTHLDCLGRHCIHTAAMPTADDAPPIGLGAAFVAMIVAVLKAVLKTVFVMDAGQALTRSAIFMLAFLIIHMAGNLIVFAGQDEFNRYAAFLESLLLIKIIEVRSGVASPGFCLARARGGVAEGLLSGRKLGSGVCRQPPPTD